MVEKNREAVGSSEKKERELQKEIESVRKQVEVGERRVKELSQIISEELSAKLKATVKISS